MTHLSTGQLAKVLEATEPQVAETVRRGKVNPAPTVVAGRRLWDKSSAMQAAMALGVFSEGMHKRIEKAFKENQ